MKSALSSDYTGPLQAAAKRMERLREEREVMARSRSRSPEHVIEKSPVPKLATNAVSRKFKKYTHSGSYVRAAVQPKTVGCVVPQGRISGLGGSCRTSAFC